jgi:multicomponent Na+:H+ antiporter subunit D
VIVGGSLLAVMYIWKIIEHAYFKIPISSASEGQVISEAPFTMLIPLWILVAANFYFGVNTSFSYGFANTAINTLFQ